MPEGDTVFRTAAALRGLLVGRPVVAARARRPGPRVERLVGSTVTGVEPRGKHLLIRFDDDLAVHVHLGMGGSWHRYAPGERWRLPPARARLVVEVPDSVVVCFDAPVVELLEQRTVELHPGLRALGPDLLGPEFDLDEALRRLRSPERRRLTLAEALLDQRAQAGVGNIYKSEVLFLERLHPQLHVEDVDDATLRRVLGTAERLLAANATAGRTARVTTDERTAPRSRTWVYGRAGRPCLRCGARIRTARLGDPPRPTYWCPRCQAGAAAVSPASP
jgi:endonuclease VIII